MNKMKGITFSVIFRANSLNYGEGTANISELKKFHRGNGEVYTFASRQSLRYDIVRLGNQLFDWNLNVVDKAQGVVQFKPDCTIADSVEMDLFGYMKTKANEGATKRSAVVRLSHAISLEPYHSDLEFLNNMGLSNRINEDANLATLEQHVSYYTYTLTIDLARVGVDQDINLPNAEKATRVKQLLEIVKLLNREIKGRQENLAPLFIIGGAYPIPNPFFQGRIALLPNEKDQLNLDLLKATVETTVFGETIKEKTRIGYVNGNFANEMAFSQVAESGSVDHFIDHLKAKIDEYFEV